MHSWLAHSSLCLLVHISSTTQHQQPVIGTMTTLVPIWPNATRHVALLSWTCLLTLFYLCHRTVASCSLSRWSPQSPQQSLALPNFWYGLTSTHYAFVLVFICCVLECVCPHLCILKDKLDKAFRINFVKSGRMLKKTLGRSKYEMCFYTPKHWLYAGWKGLTF